MPQFNFPDSPIADQEYEANGQRYVYTGKVWNIQPFDPTNLEIALDRKVDVAGDNMIGHLGLPYGDPERHQAISRAFVENYYPQEAPPTDPLKPDLVWARQGAVIVPGSAIIPLASDGKWVPTVADAPADGIAYGRQDNAWVEVAETSYVDHMDRNKVDKTGDIMTGRLTLPMRLANPIQPGPPIEMPERADDAAHKAYVDTKVPEAPLDGLAYVRINAGWEPIPEDIGDIPIMLDRKVNRGGDTMLDSLYLPPGNPVSGYEACHKNYVDSVAGRIFTSPEPPTGYNVGDGTLWWDEDSAGLYLFYNDGTSSQWLQVGGGAGSGTMSALADSLPPADDVAYGVQSRQWTPVYNINYGDVKEGFQHYDHNGWYMLDGRAVAALPDLPQARAIALGFTTNLPNAVGVVSMMMAGTLGAITGSMSRTITIAQGNLPNVTLSAASAGAHTHSVSASGLNTNSTGAHTHATDSQGAHTHNIDKLRRASGSNTISGPGRASDDSHHEIFATTSAGAHTHTAQSSGAHTHTVGGTATAASGGAHTHTVSLGGAGTAITLDIKPMAMAVNKFVFLGSSHSR